MIDFSNEKEVRQVLLDHYLNPLNKGFKRTDLEPILLNSHICADEISIQIEIVNNTVTYCQFEGSACAIATSAADVLATTILNKDINTIKLIVDEYDNFIRTGKTSNKKILEDLLIFQKIHLQKNRITCATLFSDYLKNLKVL